MESVIEKVMEAPYCLFVCNHSGGKDSQAMLIKLLEFVPANQLLVVHATLGESEWPGAMEHARQQAEAAGVPFVVAKAVKTFIEMVERRATASPLVPAFPSVSNRQCTSDLKRGPIEREIRRYAAAHGFKTIVSCMGLRASESCKRAKAEVFKSSPRNSKAGRDWYEWLPIHKLSTEEVFAIIADAGQKPHYAYGLGNQRLSCVFCIMGSANDLTNGAKANPDLYAKYCELEISTGYTLHMSRKTLPEITGITPQTVEPLN